MFKISKDTLSYFTGSFWFTIICLVVGFSYGLYTTGNIYSALSLTLIIGILGVLEVSLSFDNAIVNARVLATMSDVWKHRFITWGMVVAVFGMRVLFPLVIVSVIGNMGMIEALNVALNDHDKYASILHESHIQVAGFGGAFLLLVALGFFFDEEKDVHWVRVIEEQLSKLGALKSSEVLITLIVVTAVSYLLDEKQLQFLIAAVFGIITHEIVKGLGDFMQSSEEEYEHNLNLPGAVAKTGIASFMYLEVLDSSFSFDGVLASLVISRDIIIIALGLGIGAMFVRSLTLMFDAKGTLSEFRYLEHSAFWGILLLSGLMFVSMFITIPEVISGGFAFLIIVAGFYHSVVYNRNNPEE